MSEKDSKKQQTSLKLEKLELASSIKVSIIDGVLDKIKYLCRHMPNLEWSGVLFYTVEGTIKNASKMKITVQDLYLMDKGTVGSTEFDWDETIVGYRMDHPETIDMIVGHIHSHNNMGVFFSATDWSELNDNCVAHNYYLSIIINNQLDVIAKVAFAAEKFKYVCKDEDGKDYNLTVNTGESVKPVMLVYDCVVEMKRPEIIVSEEFITRLKAVEEKAATVAKKWEEERKKEKGKEGDSQLKLPYYMKDSKGGNGYVSKTNNDAAWGIPDYVPKGKHKEEEDEDYRNNQYFRDREKKDSRQGSKLGDDVDDEAFNDLEDAFRRRETPASLEEQFAAYLIRLGNEVTLDTLEDALDSIELADINGQAVVNAIIANYGAYYENFFGKLPSFKSDEAFLRVLEDIIRLFEEVKVKNYPYVADLCQKLEILGNRFEHSQI